MSKADNTNESLLYNSPSFNIGGPQPRSRVLLIYGAQSITILRSDQPTLVRLFGFREIYVAKGNHYQAVSNIKATLDDLPGQVLGALDVTSSG